MYRKQGLSFWLSWIVTGITLFVLIHQFLYGKEGVLRRANVIYEYNVKELDYPKEFEREIRKARLRNMMDKFRSIAEEISRDVIIQWGKRHIARLREAGVTLEDFILIFTDEDAIERFPISQREKLEKIRQDAVMDMMPELMGKMQTISFSIPEYKIEYEVTNVGQREAKNVRIKIDPGSAIYSAEEPFSENEINMFDVRDKIILIRLDRLSPGCTVKSSLWCTKIENDPFIFVSFEGGRGRSKKLFPWF